ncbi:uncharacterized protein LOC143287514 isoform X3 [Babylonia areolata]|uniref:uncharacterized protein LOC143287514 isoform X3 n=1 Tax=Babylonia areolata TaxID=304850 RepID=UPI003FD3B34A
MAGNKEKAAYENPGMQYDDDVASCQQESEPRSHSVSGEDTSTNQPSPAVRRDVDTTPSSLTGQGNGVTRSTIRHSEHHGGLVELLSVTALSDVRAAGQEEEDSYVPQALEDFVVKKQGTEVKQIKSRKVRSYYKKQDNLIEVFEDLSGATAFQSGSEDETAKSRKLTTLFSKITFAVNLMLLGAKLAASILSSSMSIISSLVDSVVDLLSGVILLWAARAIKRRDPDLYPEGRSKLEPVSIVILSVVMGLASVQLIRESGEKIATLVSDHTALPSMELSTFIIAGSTVVVKFILWLICRRVDNPSVQALALDHRNDVMSNTVAIVCGYLGSRNFQALTHLTGFIYTDPLGAILISSFIIYNWWKTGSEQVRLLTGHTASQAFHSQLTWICMNHDPRITHIDTLRAYHYGNNCLVKVDIVLPAAMCLREAHDIGESLQQKLESLPQVERAFVHVDYEFLHKPSSEHKTV